MEEEINPRKARSNFSGSGSGTRNDGNRLVNETGRKIGLNEHLISVNLRVDI